MLEQLRIQCPSCGIILDIRNSKHEAVKQITCPNCHKHLAVDFQEEEKPEAPLKPLEALYYGEMRIDLHEGVNQIPLAACEVLRIKVVRLNDGNNKSLVSALNDHPLVLLNGEPLIHEDEVALAVGDEIKIGETVLTFGQQGKVLPPQRPPVPPVPPRPTPRWPFYVVAALVAMVLCFFTLKHYLPKEMEKPKPLVEVPDTPKQKKVEDSDPPFPPTPPPPVKVKERDYSKLPQYELEKLAKENDARAQNELGNRYVRGKGRNTILLGINYLREASNNGLSEADNTLAKVINMLQRQADDGDSIAYQILMSIDN